jgi:ComF family protein
MNSLITIPVQSVLKIVKPFGDFIYPPYCMFCNRQLLDGTELICSNCLSKIPRFPDDYDIMAELKEKLKQDLYISKVLSMWEFGKDIQILIHYLKYNNHRNIGRILATKMVQELCDHEILKLTEIIIPVPLHKVRMRKRGYNQSDILAERISSMSNKPVEKNVLKRVRNTKTQTKLTAVERMRNVGNAFAVTQKEFIINKTVLLIDDVITTGSTINACARQLKINGAREVFALSVAKA